MKQDQSTLAPEDLSERLRFFSLFISLDKIACVYARETKPEQKKDLARVYQEITGDHIENRLARLNRANIAKI